MKNTSTQLLFLCFLTFIISASSCQKDEPEPDLVPITTTGANTMGFYLDGVPHNKKGKYGGFIPQGVDGGIYEGNILEISGGGGEPNSEITIYIPIDSLSLNKGYILNKRIYKQDQLTFIADGTLGGTEYICDSLHTGELTLLRLEQNMAAGTFYFDALHPETGKVIHVTDGRFDIQIFNQITSV